MLSELEARINQLRNELTQIVEVTGLNSPDTIYFSQKLDEFILIYQKVNANSRLSEYSLSEPILFGCNKICKK
ncbi:hypothetical protein CR203_18920 [Salipaludibacillus neizhouensis]|uniref:Aspartyl-phosphate phosphatase Spo0E family protein n=1 Tax=Salipaludibacillus neizhouensis TaxID=885475 RepID=A0A3A9K388_9BACI|nr:aspartyl-phosphate phosphatase Spo0E family protein [Salipaludibacillus neizhouensis]RKL65728.1 hypothetical protein CR203_18920 [Salipaludibacillus neizhouensis]